MSIDKRPEPRRSAIQIRVSASEYKRIRAAALAESRSTGNYCAVRVLSAVAAWEGK